MTIGAQQYTDLVQQSQEVQREVAKKLITTSTAAVSAVPGFAAKTTQAEKAT